MKKYKVYILVVSVLIVIAIIWNTITEHGIKDLKSDFKEVAFIRNEQNTGPVIRIYAVSLKTENWEEMEQYGNYMPHTKYGTTKIYFFLNNSGIPEELMTLSIYLCRNKIFALNGGIAALSGRDSYFRQRKEKSRV